jgi:hypothetical protein
MEEDAPVPGLAQDGLPILRIRERVFFDDLCGRHIQVQGQCFDIRPGDAYPRLAATMRNQCSRSVLEIVGDPVKDAAGSMARFKKSPKDGDSQSPPLPPGAGSEQGR